MQFALLGLAFLIGVLVPVQAALNHSLKVTADSGAVFAALISFIVGTVALLVINIASGEKLLSVQKLGDAALWQFAGGLIGAMFVFGTTMLAPRIGLADMSCLIIAGQMLGSLAFDRFGLLGLATREIGSARLVGAVLVMVGALLVNYGDRLKLG
ncbi:MAG TPA: DMT family transporter [Usitatibacteraceae bacterium]